MRNFMRHVAAGMFSPKDINLGYIVSAKVLYVTLSKTTR